MTLFRFFRFVRTLLYILEGSVLLYAITSWFPRSALYQWLDRFLSPIMKPFRFLNDLLLGRFNLPIDFSCVLAILCIQLANTFWWRLYLILRTFRR